MTAVRDNDGHVDATGFRPANAVRKVVVVTVVLVGGIGVVIMGLRVSSVLLMNETQILEQAMRRRWHPEGSQDQRKNDPDSTQPC